MGAVTRSIFYMTSSLCIGLIAARVKATRDKVFRSSSPLFPLNLSQLSPGHNTSIRSMAARPHYPQSYDYLMRGSRSEYPSLVEL